MLRFITLRTKNSKENIAQKTPDNQISGFMDQQCVKMENRGIFRTLSNI